MRIIEVVYHHCHYFAGNPFLTFIKNWIITFILSEEGEKVQGD